MWLLPVYKPADKPDRNAGPKSEATGSARTLKLIGVFSTMAQKSKKQARKTPAARPAPETAAKTPLTYTASPPVVTPGSQSRSYSADFNPDYSDTIKDLKRIGLLAGTFFTILIILSFFLT